MENLNVIDSKINELPSEIIIGVIVIGNVFCGGDK